ncbi:MAG: hypothetical protein FWG87_07230 [Defluviitaleaceae bacterium]|nr:hypothetical protein [Defluviitaleaceae bacterium]
MTGRYPPQIDERANLGTDKSVPYENPSQILRTGNCCLKSNCRVRIA